jgi:hypothetical protein
VYRKLEFQIKKNQSNINKKRTRIPIFLLCQVYFVFFVELKAQMMMKLQARVYIALYEV